MGLPVPETNFEKLGPTHTQTQNDYRNPRCACALRVKSPPHSEDVTIFNLHLIDIPAAGYPDSTVTLSCSIVNPRCACAARVTVLALCVCVSVCVCVCVCLSPLILALQAPNRLMSDTNGSSTTSAKKIMWRFR